MNNFEIPLLNPLRFRSKLGELKTIDDFYAPYIQKFQNNDYIQIQVIAKQDAILGVGIQLCNLSGRQSAATNYAQRQINNENHAFVGKINLRDVTEGHYYVKIIINERNNAQTTLFSNYICIKKKHKDTLIFDYTSTENVQNMFFSRFLNYNIYKIRVEGDMFYRAITPSNDDTSYQVSTAKNYILDSQPFDTYMLTIGGQRGIPDFLVSILNRVFSLDTVTCNSQKICKTSDASWSVSEQDGYNLKDWTIAVTKPDSVFVDRFDYLLINNVKNYIISIPSTSHPLSIQLRSTSQFVSSEDSDWLSISPTYGSSGVTTITVSALRNTGAARTATVIFTSEEGNTATLTVNQLSYVAPQGYLTDNSGNYITDNNNNKFAV